jgi:hypothetical protein
MWWWNGQDPLNRSIESNFWHQLSRFMGVINNKEVGLDFLITRLQPLVMTITYNNSQ